MRSNSSSKRLSALGLSLLLAGCVSSAPPLPPMTPPPGTSGQVLTSAPLGVPSGPTMLVPATAAPTLRLLRVAKLAWEGLTPEEQTALEARYRVAILSEETFGTVVDNQGADESTPGSNAGTQLGAAVGQLAYVDRAISNNSYSAGAHIGMAVLGAVVGSSLNTAAVSQFRFRYTVQLGDGDVQYFEEVKDGPFKHSIGVCILVPDVTMAGFHLCKQTPQLLRDRYLNKK